MLRNPVLVIILSSILLSYGCSTTPVDVTDDRVEDVPLTETESETEGEEVDSEGTVAEEMLEDQAPVPPNRDLDAGLLYDLLLTDIAMYRGDRETSISSAVSAAEASGDYRVARKATTLAMRARQYDDAIRAATIWSELEPEVVEAVYAVVIALIASGRVDEVMPKIYDLIDGNADGVDGGIRVVTALLGQQPNPTASLDIIRRLTETYPDNAQLYLGSAYIAQLHGRSALAAAAVEEALVLRPDWESAAMMKVDQLEAADRDTELESFIVDFLKRNRDSAALRTKYARLLVRDDRADEAWEQVTKALARDRKNIDTLYFAGVLGMQLQKFSEAERYLESLLELEDTNDGARMYLAAIAADDDRSEDAMRWYEEVLDPRMRLEAQLQVVQIISRTNGVDEGLSRLDQVEYKSEAEYVKYVLTRHDILIEDQRLQQAFDYLNEALHDLPENGDLLYARGLVAAELNYLDVVEADLRFLLDQDPSNAHALNALGYTLADRTDRYEEAIGLIERALALRPDDPYIIDSLGWVQYRLGNNDESIRHLRNAYMVRGDVEIAAHLGEVLWQSGLLEEANIVWDEALESQPDNPILVETLERLRP
jgi:tetratricopeptide (TPR) repeat protein